MIVQELWTYPIKSCRGVQIQSMIVDHAGPQFDREWMFVNSTGRFVSQREHSKLAQIKIEFVENDRKLRVTVADKKFYLRTDIQELPIQEVEIWGTRLKAFQEQGPIAQAVSEFLGEEVKLIRYGHLSKRLKPAVVEGFQPEVKFADSLPLLAINLMSVQDLNRDLSNKSQAAVTHDRFRGNLIFNGTVGFEEDNWIRIKVGEVLFSQSKKSSRCSVITIDQQTGIKTGPEPLKTLAETRLDQNKVNFGQLFIPENSGRINVGDPISILQS